MNEAIGDTAMEIIEHTTDEEQLDFWLTWICAGGTL